MLIAHYREADRVCHRPQEAQVAEVEALVNAWIQEAHPVETRTMALAEAKAAGAVAMFGEKYSDTVRFAAL